MACRAVLRSIFMTETWRPLRPSWDLLSLRSFGTTTTTTAAAAKRGSGGCYGTMVVRAREVHFWNGIQKPSCSGNETPAKSEDEIDQGPPQEAVLKAISEVSKTEGRVGQTTNVVIGGTVADGSTNEWLALDQTVNSYPCVRGFIAIGTGGDDFVRAMVVAVESVLQQPIPESYRITANISLKDFVAGCSTRYFKKWQGRVRRKVSSRGKYVSVNIGPVQVVSSEQVSLFLSQSLALTQACTNSPTHTHTHTRWHSYTCTHVARYETHRIVHTLIKLAPPEAILLGVYARADVEAISQLAQLRLNGRVRRKVSSRGKYVSVNIGPVQVVSSEQVSLFLSQSLALTQACTNSPTHTHTHTRWHSYTCTHVARYETHRIVHTLIKLAPPGSSRIQCYEER
ncbi:hypothetical protein GOBAR_AA10104 [Gossypium barbadense]|uniref:Uncharacterized protein n=1 Tax=Gossypium barbadense TaxID=3634 RepID=A0A2P5Y4Q6_GOSBA|nr:hypothetical protein GOBAR_AA10104 [Gossypium barbadense]